MRRLLRPPLEDRSQARRATWTSTSRSPLKAAIALSQVLEPSWNADDVATLAKDQPRSGLGARPDASMVIDRRARLRAT